MAEERNAPEPRRIAPLLLAIFFPGMGYLLLGRWTLAFGLSLVFSVLTNLVLLAAAEAKLVWFALGLAVMAALWIGSVVHVGFALRNASRTPRVALVVIAWIALGIVGNYEARDYRKTLVEAFKIPSGSMIPTLQVGDHLFIDKRAVTPKRGDVIVFNYMPDPTKQFIKRCVAIGGDTVEMHDDVISVNGKPLDDKPAPGSCAYEDYDEEQDRFESRTCRAFDETIDGRTFRVIRNEPPSSFMRELAPTQVPAGGCWALGDNRDNSHDSRYIGSVPAVSIVGTARVIWWGRQSGRIGQPVRLRRGTDVAATASAMVRAWS